MKMKVNKNCLLNILTLKLANCKPGGGAKSL